MWHCPNFYIWATHFLRKYNRVSQHQEAKVKHTCDPNVFHLWDANGKQQKQNEQTNL